MYPTSKDSAFLCIMSQKQHLISIVGIKSKTARIQLTDEVVVILARAVADVLVANDICFDVGEMKVAEGYVPLIIPMSQRKQAKSKQGAKILIGRAEAFIILNSVFLSYMLHSCENEKDRDIYSQAFSQLAKYEKHLTPKELTKVHMFLGGDQD